MRKIVCVSILAIMSIACMYGCSANQSNKYKIDFYDEQNEICYSISTNGNEKILLPSISRDGLVLCGWYWDKDFTKEIEEDSFIGIFLNSNVAVFSKWITVNQYQTIILTHERDLLSNEYNELNYYVNYYTDKRISAYDNYLSKQRTYNSITVKKIRIYRSGGGFVYEDDPDDLARKNNAKSAMNNAKEYYEQLLKLENEYRKLAEEKKIQISEINKQITELNK